MMYTFINTSIMYIYINTTNDLIQNQIQHIQKFFFFTQHIQKYLESTISSNLPLLYIINILYILYEIIYLSYSLNKVQFLGEEEKSFYYIARKLFSLLLSSFICIFHDMGILGRWIVHSRSRSHFGAIRLLLMSMLLMMS
jgi:hypothetical protein